MSDTIASEKQACPGRPCISPWGLVTAFGAVLGAATIAGFLGQTWWFFDLFAHFKVQLCLASAAVGTVFVCARRKRLASLMGVLALLNLGAIVPLYLGKPAQEAHPARSYRCLLMNVNTGTGDPSRVSRAIETLSPDILVLEEVNDPWLDALASPLKAFPHSEVMPRADNFGIAVFSKHPFTRNEIREIGEAGVPSVVAEVNLPDGRLTVIATHPLPPAGAEYSRLRNDQLKRLVPVVREADAPVIVIGDLNATPWSGHFKRLLADSGLRDSSQGRGITPTWPTHIPLLLIPIDHFLHSDGIRVLSKGRGPAIGSDHYPLVVDFAVRETH